MLRVKRIRIGNLIDYFSIKLLFSLLDLLMNALCISGLHFTNLLLSIHLRSLAVLSSNDVAQSRLII